VPVCLPLQEHIDYEDVKAVVNAFKPDKLGNLDPFNLTKATIQVTVKSDEACENRIKNLLSYDAECGLCVFDDSLLLSNRTNNVSLNTDPEI
jgi:hypothetical protein